MTDRWSAWTQEAVTPELLAALGDKCAELLVHAVDLQTEIDSLQPPPSLTGRWRKCKASSDSMEPACDAVALPWVLRRAIAVLNLLEVRLAASA